MLNSQLPTATREDKNGRFMTKNLYLNELVFET